MEEVSEFRGRYVYLCEDSTEGILLRFMMLLQKDIEKKTPLSA